jgi:hypothetical protein
VSALLAGFVADSYRWGSSSAPWYETVAIVCAIVVMAVACALIFRHLRRREREPKRVVDQWQALNVMGEMCPHGWQAQITVYGRGAPVPEDAPALRAPLVELEWLQFEQGSARVALARRMWARSIRGALQTMVEDRRTDITLGQGIQAGVRERE